MILPDEGLTSEIKLQQRGPDKRLRRRMKPLSDYKWIVLDQRKNRVLRAKLLKEMVGAWGFEPQIPTVSKTFEALTYSSNDHLLRKTFQAAANLTAACNGLSKYG
jgi:hypothetical protein